MHPLSHMKSSSLGQSQRSTCEFKGNAGHLRAGANRASAAVPRFLLCSLIYEHLKGMPILLGEALGRDESPRRAPEQRRQSWDGFI